MDHSSQGAGSLEKRSDVESNFWLQGRSAFPAYPALAADRRADWLIVGAGFTGLAAAAHLAHLCPADRIVVVEGQRLGQGSACRSSGFVVSLGHFGGSANETATLYRLGMAAIAELRRQVEFYRIDCDWQEDGRLIAARGNPGLRTLARIRRVLERVGSGYTQLSSSQLEQRTGMAGYLDGVRQDDSVQVNPAKLLRGLVLALPPNVEVFESSYVQSLHRDRQWVAHLPGGRITADRVLMTNNAGATKLGLARHRVFPMQTFIGVYEGGARETRGWGDEQDWGVTSVERIGSSVRRVNNRLFFRSSAFCGFGEALHAIQREAIVDLQRDALAQRFPRQPLELIGLWSGGIGVTANGSQAFGQVGEGLYLSVGYNGHGIAQGTISGKLLVDLALGRESGLLHGLRSLPKPWWIPGPRLLFPIVERYKAWLSWRFREEL